MKSQYVCARCGLAVHLWRLGRSEVAADDTYWKHSGGWHTEPSCGKRPHVVERERYERERDDFLAALRERRYGVGQEGR